MWKVLHSSIGQEASDNVIKAFQTPDTLKVQCYYKEGKGTIEQATVFNAESMNTDSRMS
ncbi:MAG: hypothetical protein AAGI23_14720 [Bacteroidota bacterium]